MPPHAAPPRRVTAIPFVQLPRQRRRGVYTWKRPADGHLPDSRTRVRTESLRRANPSRDSRVPLARGPFVRCTCVVGRCPGSPINPALSLRLPRSLRVAVRAGRFQQVRGVDRARGLPAWQHGDPSLPAGQRRVADMLRRPGPVPVARGLLDRRAPLRHRAPLPGRARQVLAPGGRIGIRVRLRFGVGLQSGLGPGDGSNFTAIIANESFAGRWAWGVPQQTEPPPGGGRQGLHTPALHQEALLGAMGQLPR